MSRWNHFGRGLRIRGWLQTCSSGRSRCPFVALLRSSPPCPSASWSTCRRRRPQGIEPRPRRRPPCASRQRRRPASRCPGSRRSTTGNFWYCVQQNGSRVLPGRHAANDLHPPVAGPGRTHTFSVYAVDVSGNRSANSNTVSYTTPPDATPPSPPPTLSLTSVFPTRISVAWTASVDTVSQVWYHAPRERESLLRRSDRHPRGDPPAPVTLDDARVQGHRPRRLRQHRPRATSSR